MTFHSKKPEVGSAIIHVNWLMIFLWLPVDAFNNCVFKALDVENSV
jgi:hypothetical protein